MPLNFKECVSYSILVISSHSLKTVYFFKTASQGWKHIFELTPEEARLLKIQTFDSSSLQTIVATLDSLKEEQVELRTQVGLLHSDMGVLSCKVNELIRLTNLVHHGAKFAIAFTPSDLDRASAAVDHLIRISSSNPHFT